MKSTFLTQLFFLLSFATACSSEKHAIGPLPPIDSGNKDMIHLSLLNETKSISDAVLGYNTQSIKGPGWDKKEFIDKIVELNPGNFRYPGGTVGNFWDWRTGYFNQIGQDANVISPSSQGPLPYKLEDVKAVYDKTGTEPIYMLNVLTSTLEEQLAMLRHARDIGLPVNLIEMGNEYYLDDHPTNYNYLNVFPEITDYTDTCRVWTQAIRKEFPNAKISMVGVCTPSSWKRPRANAWNSTIMNNMDGIECDSFTIHAYPKSNNTGQTPLEMLGTSLEGIKRSKILDPSIDDKYTIWVTEYNYESGSNPYPGQWVHGLSAALMSAELIYTPRVEHICFFNLTAGKPASAIYDTAIDLLDENGAKVKASKYSLSASGEALKLVSKAQRKAANVTGIEFSNNPTFISVKKESHNTLYGYLFRGEHDKVLLINIGDTAQTIDLSGIGITLSHYEQVSASSLKTAIMSSSLQRLDRKLDNRTIVLRPYSITVVD